MTTNSIDEHKIHQAGAHIGEDWVDGETYSEDCPECLLIELQASAGTVRIDGAYGSDNDRSAQRIRAYARISHLASRLAWLGACEITSRELAERYPTSATPKETEK